MNNPAKVAVNLEKVRDLFCAMCKDEGFGINEVNQTLIAMNDFICEPTLKHSQNLDLNIVRFKKTFSEEIFEN